jgi:hypothetical protein
METRFREKLEALANISGAWGSRSTDHADDRLIVKALLDLDDRITKLESASPNPEESKP